MSFQSFLSESLPNRPGFNITGFTGFTGFIDSSAARVPTLCRVTIDHLGFRHCGTSLTGYLLRVPIIGTYTRVSGCLKPGKLPENTDKTVFSGNLPYLIGQENTINDTGEVRLARVGGLGVLAVLAVLAVFSSFNHPFYQLP